MFKKSAFTFLLFTSLFPFANGQSSSVFDANYFDNDNVAPPLKVGKGFHINDVYKQTKGCFTIESCKQSNLTPQQSGKKTTIKIFHTKTNEEFNSVRKRGASGKISFLNLFSFGGKKIEEYANKEVIDEERIIFSANVDFGMYSFDVEPILTDDAKVLIEQKKLQDFVKYYGTHYISGIRKESSITVILTKIKTENNYSNSESTEITASAKNPVGWKGSIKSENTDKINNILTSEKFTSEIEIHGPEIEQGSLKGEISKILNGTSDKKADAISAIIEGALKNISDPNQSIITQYYYSPFSLYQLDGIYWDEKKQNELTKLNEAIINVYSAKTLLSELISESGKKQLMEAFGNNDSEDNNQKFLAVYNKSLPTLTNLNNKADLYLKNLEAKYIQCSDVYCPNTMTCCANDLYIQEIEKFNFSTKIEKEQEKLFLSVIQLALEINAPECEKKKMGVINIENLSTNPYSLYQGDTFLGTIQGKGTIAFTVELGDYVLKAVQDSGFLMYATVNQRRAKITAICQEINLRIGFED